MFNNFKITLEMLKLKFYDFIYPDMRYTLDKYIILNINNKLDNVSNSYRLLNNNQLGFYIKTETIFTNINYN